VTFAVPDNRPPGPSRKLLRALLALTILLLLSTILFLRYIGFLTGNLRTVIPGRVYRSAQLDALDLRRLIREKSLRTVISLRGGDESDAWFRREEATCREAGVALQRVRLRATALPPPEELQTLLQLFDHSEYPVLFHCQAGADRSGLAATLYLALYAGLPLDSAQSRGLTWRYGHFPFWAREMDDFFALYRQDGAGQDLRVWIEQRYPQLYQARKSRRGKLDKRATLVPAVLDQLPDPCIPSIAARWADGAIKHSISGRVAVIECGNVPYRAWGAPSNRRPLGLC